MKTILLIFLCGLFIQLEAQVINNGATIIIKDGGIQSSESIYNQKSGVIINQGVLSTEQDLLNLEAAQLISEPNDAGIYKVVRNFENSGELSNLQLQFEGQVDSDIQSGNQPIQSLHIAKSSGASVHLIQDPILIMEALEFGSNANRLRLHEQDLLLAETADIFGYNQNNYLVTTSSGQLKKQSLEGYFFFPIGDESAYHPASLYLEASEDVGISLEEREQTEGDNFRALTHSWFIETEDDTPKEVKLYWNAGKTNEHFDSEQTQVFEYQNNLWLVISESESTKSSPQYSTTSSITGSGIYTVGIENDEPFDVENNSVSSNENDSGFLASILVYPNPTIDFIRIDFSKLALDTRPIQISLLDLLGQRVLSKKIYAFSEAIHQLDFPKGVIPPGMYTLQVQDGDRLISTERIIIQTSD